MFLNYIKSLSKIEIDLLVFWSAKFCFEFKADARTKEN